MHGVDEFPPTRRGGQRPAAAASSSTVPTVPTTPARRAWKDSVCHPRDRSRAMAAATTGLTVYVRFSEGRIWLIALCRPARRERRGQPTPPAKGRGGGGPWPAWRATPRPLARAMPPTARADPNPHPKLRVGALLRGSALAFARSACANPWHGSGNSPGHSAPWQSTPAVPGTLPLTLLTGLFITVTDADRAPPGGR